MFGSSTAHKALRRLIVDEHKLDAVVKLPSGVFKPYAGVSTAILFFTKTSSGGTDWVWFYDVQADGLSLDDKRSPTEANDLPDILARWSDRPSAAVSIDRWSEAERPRTAQSFLVSRDEIVAQGYDLSVNRYKQVEHDEVTHRAPAEILADLAAVEQEIADATTALARSLSSSK
jgi:type I restriction enzyme M protein